MFGMGFTEILIIGVIAILFIGPDKLPEAMVEITKFFRGVKQTINSAKESIDQELNIAEMKEGVNSYKQEFLEATNDLKSITEVDILKDELEDVKQMAKVSPHVFDQEIPEDERVAPPAPKESQEVTFKKRKKSPKAQKVAYADEKKTNSEDA